MDEDEPFNTTCENDFKDYIYIYNIHICHYILLRKGLKEISFFILNMRVQYKWMIYNYLITELQKITLFQYI